MRTIPTVYLACLAVSAVVTACRATSVASTGFSPTSAPAAQSGSRKDLERFIDSMADAPEFSNAHWGILIVDPERGDTLYARNAGKLFMPASNMKILTSATAMAQLGPDYRFHTIFSSRGGVVGDTLFGDLLVSGRGDPSVSDHMVSDAMTPLRAIADSLAARGVKRVAGRVLATGNAFPGEVFGYGWTYDDFESAYSAPIGALLFNEGFSEIHLRGGDHEGDAVQATVSPARGYPRIHLSATTGAPAMDSLERRKANTLSARKDSATWDVVIDGRLAPHDTATIVITHHNPNDAYLAALTEALRDRGIVIDGRIIVDDRTLDPPSGETLATLTSPPLKEILKAMMKPSQNQIAEMLFRAVALQATGTGSSDSARAVVERQLAAWGAAPSEAVIRDGSGLSRYDYISPRTIVRVLDAMRRSPNFPVYYDALPIAGVDGTIRNRMKGTAAENDVRAKTGSVAQARSLSGYVTTADHHMLIFSLLANNWTVPVRAVERVQDAIAARLAAMQLR